MWVRRKFSSHSGMRRVLEWYYLGQIVPFPSLSKSTPGACQGFLRIDPTFKAIRLTVSGGR
jgi:hypothetical protein